MDLFAVKQLETTDVEILVPPDRVRSGVIFTLAGPNHPKRRGHELKAQRQYAKRFNRAGKMQLDDPEEREERDTDYLVVCTLGWKNFTRDGEPYPYSEENARRLYEDKERSFVRLQILEALRSDENFFASSASS